MKLVKKVFQFILNNRKGQIFPLFFILLITGYFYFQNLGTSYITLWDEAVHVNVVKNLSQDWWPPRLHLTDIGRDFQDWTNNYIWVHKPLLPLYLQAMFYKISPTLFAFRLPGVIFAFLCIGALYFLVKKHFSYSLALITTSLFAFNPYLLELVKGRQFSGLHDLMFCFFGILVLNQILNIIKFRQDELPPPPLWKRVGVMNLPPLWKRGGVMNLPSIGSKRGSYEFALYWFKEGDRGSCLLFGLFTGLAYLSKGGLALLFFVPMFALLFASKNKKPIIFNLLFAVFITFIIIFPEKIYLLIVYPAEYFFEQGLQILHLFTALEYWGRPWDYYLTVYLRDMVSPHMYLPVVAGMIFSFFNWQKDQKIKILAIWVLAFFIPLSAGKTQIANFIFPTLPVLILLSGLWFFWLIKNKKLVWLLALFINTLFVYGFIRLDVFKVKWHLFQEGLFIQRFALLVLSVLSLGLFFVLLKFINERVDLSRLVNLSLSCVLFLVFGTSVRAMQLNNQKIFTDWENQKNLQLLALTVKSQIPQNAIVLTYLEKVKKSHLYFQYWSGIDAMEINDRQPLFLLIKQLPANRPLFIFSDSPLDLKTPPLLYQYGLYFHQIQ